MPVGCPTIVIGRCLRQSLGESKRSKKNTVILQVLPNQPLDVQYLSQRFFVSHNDVVNAREGLNFRVVSRTEPLHLVAMGKR